MSLAIKRIYKSIRYFCPSWYRFFTSPLRRLPDFIIIGVQKGGTTSLFHYLSQHPDVKLSSQKEVHFFDISYHKGVLWYRSFFPFIFDKTVKITGEASPYYIFHPHTPERIKKLLPGAKIIVLLRNPVNRAFSHYQMVNKKGQEKAESFEEAIALEEERVKNEIQKIIKKPYYRSFNHQAFTYLSRSEYYPQLKRLLSTFRKEQILFIKSENLFQNPRGELSKVYDFLGIQEIYPDDLKAQYKGEYTSIDSNTYKKLIRYYKRDEEKITSLIGDEFRWD